MIARTMRRVAMSLTPLLLFAPVVWAQEAAPHVVSLQEALRAADLLPDLKAAEAALRAAEEGVKLAGRLPDPSFGFATHSVSARQSYSLSVPLPWPGRGPRVDVAKAGVAAAGTDRDGARLIARRALRIAWYTTAAREDMAKAATDRAARAKAGADAVTALFDAGRVALLEVSRARADAAMTAADAAQSEEELQIAEGVLRRLLGIESGRIVVERPLPAFSVEGDLETATATALTHSPSAKAAEAKVRGAEASVRLASALRFPAISMELGADVDDPTQPGTDKSIGVSLTLPIGGGPGLGIAKGERDRALALRDQTQREIKDAVEQAWRTARAARTRYETLGKEAVPAATQAAELAQVAYREGRADIFRVLDAERALAEARSGLAEAYLAWGLARADLLSVMGEDVP
jgi:outer membrane protein TolC